MGEVLRACAALGFAIVAILFAEAFWRVYVAGPGAIRELRLAKLRRATPTDLPPLQDTGERDG